MTNGVTKRPFVSMGTIGLVHQDTWLGRLCGCNLVSYHNKFTRRWGSTHSRLISARRARCTRISLHLLIRVRCSDYRHGGSHEGKDDIGLERSKHCNGLIRLREGRALPES